MEILAQVLSRPRWSDTTGKKPAQIADFQEVVKTVISLAIQFGALVIFIMIIIGGFKWLTAGGNPEKVASARQTLTWAIGGFIILILSYLILKLIENITGAPITDFKVVR